MTPTAQALTATAQAMAFHFPAMTWMHWLFIAVAGGVGGLRTWIQAKVKALTAWIATAAGKQEVSDLEAALPIVVKALQDSQNAEATQLAAWLTDAIGLLKAKGVQLALALGLGLALAGSARAGALSVSLVPAAQSLSITAAPFVGASFFRAGNGVVLEQENDGLTDLEICAVMGPYNFGFLGGLDIDADANRDYGNVGVVAGIEGAQCAVVWRQTGALIALTFTP